MCADDGVSLCFVLCECPIAGAVAMVVDVAADVVAAAAVVAATRSLGSILGGSRIIPAWTFPIA